MAEATAEAESSALAPQEQMLEIILGYWKSRAVAVAAELELADLLAEGPLHIDVLAARTETDSSSLFRLMRVGIFTQVAPREFANTRTSEYLHKKKPGSQWALVRLNLSPGLGEYDSLTGLSASIHSGHAAFDQMFGCGYWQFLQQNPEKSAIFKEAMHSFSLMTVPPVTACYHWSRFPVIADIGGGIGTQLVDILNSHPMCRGILFDHSHVIADAIPHDSVERVAGDFFETVPAGADAYVLRLVIHDWGDQEARAILHNVRQAMQPAARLVLIESVIPETPEPSFFKWADLVMLTLLGGRERTATEFAELFRQTGLELEQIITTPSPLSIIIGRFRPE